MSAPEPEAKQKPAPAKTARRRSREFALQGLYAWQMAHGSPREIVEQVKGYEGFERANAELAETIVRGVAERSAELEALIAPFLDRSFASLSPVERAILYIRHVRAGRAAANPVQGHRQRGYRARQELRRHGRAQVRHGVLEKLAAKLRPAEFEGARRAPRTAQPRG